MFSWRSLLSGVVLVGLIALGGCSRGGGSFATVSGVVTLNGTPVDGAKVIFHSTVEGAGSKATSYAALTDSTGKYLIAAIGKDPGIPPGMYKVTIVKYEGGKMNVATPEGIDQGQLDAMASDGAGSAKQAAPVNLLPAVYAAVGSSKLSVTIESGPNKNVNFDLKGK